MNRAALIERIQEARKTLEKLLTPLQSAPVERDRFVSHLYQSRRVVSADLRRAGKGGKQIERCLISTFQMAESMGFKGDRDAFVLKKEKAGGFPFPPAFSCVFGLGFCFLPATHEVKSSKGGF